MLVFGYSDPEAAKVGGAAWADVAGVSCSMGLKVELISNSWKSYGYGENGEEAWYDGGGEDGKEASYGGGGKGGKEGGGDGKKAWYGDGKEEGEEAGILSIVACLVGFSEIYLRIVVLAPFFILTEKVLKSARAA